ncbi:baseplate assembly protein J, partial [methanotrophic bacterial endosymbiont of Bathymodiolus sp.]
DNSLLEVVRVRLNDKEVRPLTDEVTVQKASVIYYQVDADLILYEGPDGEVVRQTAFLKASNYVNQHHLLGNDITLSGLYSALHQEGVQRVVLRKPVADLVVQPDRAAWCDSLLVRIGGRDE